MEVFETFAPIVAYGLFGLLEVFAGYRLFRVLVVLLGVLTGLTFGPQVYATLVGGTVDNTMASLLVSFIAAVVLGVLVFYAYGAGVFLWAGLVGYTVAGAYLDGPVFPLVVGVVFGLLVALLERPLIILLTSLHGAWLALAATSVLVGPSMAITPLPAALQAPALSDQPLLLVAGVFLALAGIIVQRATPSRMEGIGRRRQRR